MIPAELDCDVKTRVVTEKIRGFDGWGLIDFDDTSVFSLEIGPLNAWISHAPHEWKFVWDQGKNPLEERANLIKTQSAPEPLDPKHIARFATSWEGRKLRIYPSLADRSVVVRPETPTWLGAHDEVVFYVSTPLWLCIETQTALPILEIPTYRPSDTWFGDVQDGELAYASRTAGRTSLEDVQAYHARALTRVSVRNATQTPMLIERINIPVPVLTLYQDARERFWTEGISLVAEERGNMAHLKLGPSAPKEAERAEKITLPRAEPTSNVLVRALHKLLG